MRKLKFVWKMGSVPPHYGQELTACVLCDNHLKEDMEIRIPSMNSVQPRNRGGTSGRGGGGRSSTYNSSAGRNGGRGNNGGRGGGGGPSTQGIQCFKCGGPHYASACTSNQSSSGNNNGGRGRGRGGTERTFGNTNSGRGSGGIQCYNCGGPHYAPACPNKR